MKMQRTQNSQNNYEENNNVRCEDLHDFQTNPNITVVKTVWYGHQNTYFEQKRTQKCKFMDN